MSNVLSPPFWVTGITAQYHSLFRDEEGVDTDIYFVESENELGKVGVEVRARFTANGQEAPQSISDPLLLVQMSFYKPLTIALGVEFMSSNMLVPLKTYGGILKLLCAHPSHPITNEELQSNKVVSIEDVARMYLQPVVKTL